MPRLLGVPFICLNEITFIIQRDCLSLNYLFKRFSKSLVRDIVKLNLYQ